MKKPASTLCFHCGQDAGAPPRLNRLGDGRLCPACADRVLQFLPPLLPGFGEHEGAAAGDEVAHVDLGFETDGDPDPDWNRPA